MGARDEGDLKPAARKRPRQPEAIPADCSAALDGGIAIIERWPPPSRRAKPGPPGAPFGPSRRADVPPASLAQDAAASCGTPSPGSRDPSAPAGSSRSSGRDDVESRLVVRDGTRWSLAHGPFRRADFTALARAQLDAARPGRQSCRSGGRRAVAPVRVPAVRAPRRPHGELCRARRRRRTARGFVRRLPAAGLRPPPLALRCPGRRLAIKRGLPLKILRRFSPDDEDDARAGRHAVPAASIAHDGVAIDACTTYSIGFALPPQPSSPPLSGFPARRARACRDAMPTPTRARSTRRPRSALRCAGATCELLKGLAWDDAMAARFLGAHLSEPKPHVFFEPPKSPLARAAFRRSRREARSASSIFARNSSTTTGTSTSTARSRRGPRTAARALRRFANGRALASPDATRLPPEAAAILYNWYRDGYLTPAPPDGGEAERFVAALRERSRPLPNRSPRSIR